MPNGAALAVTPDKVSSASAVELSPESPIIVAMSDKFDASLVLNGIIVPSAFDV